MYTSQYVFGVVYESKRQFSTPSLYSAATAATRPQRHLLWNKPGTWGVHFCTPHSISDLLCFPSLGNPGVSLHGCAPTVAIDYMATFRFRRRYAFRFFPSAVFAICEGTRSSRPYRRLSQIWRAPSSELMLGHSRLSVVPLLLTTTFDNNDLAFVRNAACDSCDNGRKSRRRPRRHHHRHRHRHPRNRFRRLPLLLAPALASPLRPPPTVERRRPTAHLSRATRLTGTVSS